jgi:glycosyltransferase involved in cell wall biosynthesis
MISVIMPAYNAEKFIAEAIESILNQTYRDFEFIIVDDGSSDRTLEIINEYAQRDGRIRVLKGHHGGVSKAANMAMEAAKYPWVARMDADDIAMPHRLERQIEAIQSQPEVILWGAYARQINVDGKQIGFVEHGPTTLAAFEETRRTGNPVFILNPTTIFRKEIALQLGGFDPNLQAASDEELWSRMRDHGPMLTLPEHLISYRIHGSSISSNKLRLQATVHNFIRARTKARAAGGDLTFEQYLNNLKARPLLTRIREDVRLQGRLYYRRAGANLSQKNYPAAIGYFGLAFLCHPAMTFDRVKMRLRNNLTRKQA